MAQFDTEYQRLEASYSDSPPGEEDLLVHVPEGSKSPWHHIENLDLFFSRVYNLHQKNGFTCMLIGEIFELMQFLFVVAFTTFLVSCVDYDILFANKMVNHSLHPTEPVKVTLPDAFLPAQVCSARIQENGSLITILVIAGVFWVHRLIKFIYNICCYWEIHSFYLHALRIPMSALPYCTWQEVQARIVQTQKEHQICIHKRELTELDIYHRILRFQNYMVALVNKSLLPLRFRLPGLGEVVFFTRGLKYNFELILFWGPGSLFLNEWSLKSEYKRGGQRLELAQRLSNRILWIGIANFLLCPLILIWQILYAFFSYAEVLKREPGALGARCWSLYGRCYLRHFNELEHELQSRLNRGYKPASKYMNCFLSPLLTLLAKNCAFFAGSILAVLIALTIYDEDVLAVEHVLTTVTLLGVTVTVCRSFIPDQHMVFCPEQLLRVILAHIHYMPDHWQGNAHRSQTRDEFAQLFQYKAVFILEELLSPIVTPLILIFCLRPRALEIIDFFRNFTVEVVGVGDTCSFAQMDVRQHGHPQWLSGGQTEASVYQQAEDGKTELSLMHFAITNPGWQPPRESTAFLGFLKEQVQRDGAAAGLAQGGLLPENALFTSIQSLQSESEPLSLIANVVAGSSCRGPPLPRDLQGSRHRAEVASALRSFSPLQPGQAPTGRAPSTMTGSGSTSSRPRLNLSGMCGTAGRVMRVERVPPKRGERVPGARSLSPAPPATPVLHPGLELLRPLPCMGASRGATEASQILEQCPGLPLTSLGCPLEDGLKTGSQHQGTQSPCPKRAQRMSFPLRCTRSRMEILCCPLQLLRWAPRETEAFLAPIAAYCTPPPPANGMDRAGSVPSTGCLPARKLWPAPHCP
ncbi:autophagy-related protein 9A isoform X1 [Physeter macrocephalus]|uniref:Autophagy-related protein 9 n=1 Tax=Physeter macrocephalus TaxID=9755 RepID=A0A9W2WJC1_PHYMC|nr:autophagy-related protein 9A isoform X1 [Physeter catodon]XP_054939202.1 autophagy-related protein 9A isoform X1 [Physeter catodon]XP_054939203.1 autophagy-related protein 9A isoform X1 [Physeter catodon]XP_054939204.1 autophagy-related protein 9A isoform X1 [Physeter catodon]XP_054939205.1 autophagy-related protein 9A isoform X1 [Physeter catodon]